MSPLDVMPFSDVVPETDKLPELLILEHVTAPPVIVPELYKDEAETLPELVKLSHVTFVESISPVSMLEDVITELIYFGQAFFKKKLNENQRKNMIDIYQNQC
jgi:hypothetical protein